MKGKITLIQVLLIFVLVICGVMLFDNISDNNKDKGKLDYMVDKLSTVAPDGEPIDTDAYEVRKNKLKALYELNNDTVGWIKVTDTAIDYPVVQNTQSNAYYLHRSFEREYSSAGIPFLDFQCKSDGTGDNTIIYAHNMRNGTMFHDLLNYKDEEFYKTHKYIEFDTLENAGRYEIFAVIRTKVGSKNEFRYYDFTEAKTAADFDSFVAEFISRSLYKTDIIPKYGEKLLTLSTCSYNTDNERFVVAARRLEK